MAVDLAGGFHGTVWGASRVAGKIRGALYFDGQGAYLDCGISKAYRVLGDASISLWIRPLDFGTFFTMEGDAVDLGTSRDNVVFFLRYRQPHGYIIYTHEHGAGSNEQYIFDPIAKDAWTHLVVVRNTRERTVRVYYDGVQQADVYHYQFDPENPQDELSLTMGARTRGDDPFHGYMDEVMIYERVLSNSEIEQLFEFGRQSIPHSVSSKPGPGFADPNNGDYHLKSEYGRYWPQHDIWVSDRTTSPGVDAGDPNSHVANEPTPNGGRINIGAYGGTGQASLSSMPVHAHWQFDETSGDTAFDLAGNNHGKVYGATWASGKMNGALSFDGVDDYVDCGNHPFLAPDLFTISLWIYPQASSISRSVLQKGGIGADAGDYGFELHAARYPTFWLGNGPDQSILFSSSKLPLDEWSHVVLRRTREEASLYVDGSQRVSKTHRYVGSATDEPLIIGGAPSFPYQGKVDDLQIWSFPLSDEEIKDLSSSIE